MCGVLVNHFKTMIKSQWKQHESPQITGGSRTMGSRHPVCHKPCMDPGGAGHGSSLVSPLARSAEGVDTEGTQHTWKGWGARDRAGWCLQRGPSLSCWCCREEVLCFQKEEPECNQGKEVFPTCGCEGTLAWKIPWMEKPGRLQSMGSLRVGHD